MTSKAEEVSKTAILPHDDGPDKRSVYPPGFDLNKVVSLHNFYT